LYLALRDGRAMAGGLSVRFYSVGTAVVTAANCFVSSAWGQTAPTLVAVAAPSAPAPPLTRPAETTLVDIELAEAVGSKTHKRGDTFAIRLVAPFTIDGQSIPAGAVGVGQVVDAAPAGPLGRPAKLLLAARYVEFEGRRLPLHGFRLGGAGKDATNTILVVGTLISPLGSLFIHGGEIEIPAGTRAQAKISAPVFLPVVAPAAAQNQASASNEVTKAQ
jgi:hypothetical protein